MSKKIKPEDFNLEDYGNGETKEDVVYKPDEDIPVGKEMAQAIGMAGIRAGTVSAMYGLSNSGKTSILLHIAAQAQKQGIIPILIITENKMDWDRARKMGLDTDKSKCIIREDLEYLEDVYNYISQKIEDVKTGRLPRDIIVLWDSVASTPSKESLEIDSSGNIKKKYGPQKNAAVIGYYNPIIMKRVTSTRRIDSANTATVVMLTQAYVKPAEFPGGVATTVPNGGEKIWFPLSLCLEIKEGGQIQTVIDGVKNTFGTVCKIKVVKNHLTELSCSGDFIITADAFIPNTPEAVKVYKESKKLDWKSYTTDDGEIIE